MGSKVLSLLFLASLTCLASSASQWTVKDGSSYMVVTSHRLNWDNAQAFCNSMGAYLAITESQAEQEYISHQTVGKGDAFFIGGSHKSGWVWSTNARITVTYWAQGQPPQNAAYCLALVSYLPAAANWRAYLCGQPLFFICEK